MGETANAVPSSNVDICKVFFIHKEIQNPPPEL
jgi:hypothetical protein